MRTTNTLMRCVLASVLVAACDHTVDEEDPAPITPTEVTAADITHYRGLVQVVDTAVRDYQAAMAGEPDCLALHASYDQQVRPVITHMLSMAAPLDRFIKDQGGAEADLDCAAHAMIDELDDHHHVACMWPTAAADRDESDRHIGVMLLYTTHVTERCDEMATGMAGEGYTWHPMQCVY